MSKEDAELFKIMEERLYSGVIADVLDDLLGLGDYCMSEKIRPVWTSGAVAGRAYPLLFADTVRLPETPYGVEIEALDKTPEGAMVVCACHWSTNGGVWGELLSTLAKRRGARGAVMDGLTRDTRKIAEMNFPVFAAGIRPTDSYGRTLALEYDVPVECGGVRINPGDVVFADEDGVVVIPKGREEKVVARALEKAQNESKTREELRQGVPLRRVFDKYGVL